MSKPQEKIDCEKCQDTGLIDGEGCQACCPHEYDPDSGGYCLNCPANRWEDGE